MLNGPHQKTYQKQGYLDKSRWISYYYQTSLVQQYIQAGESVLEIGVGNGLVTNFLKNNYQLTGLDINANLNPDIVASVDNLSHLPAGHYTAVLCAEVLEHLPFEKFNKSLQEIIRVANKYIIISLPYWGYTFGCKLRLPFWGVKVIKFKVNGFKKHNSDNSAGHYWEIGKKNYSLRKIKKIFLQHNLKIIKLFWDLDDPYHYYFVLEKI